MHRHTHPVPLVPLLAATAVAAALLVAGCGDHEQVAQPQSTAPNTPPEWARHAVWYQVFVERFSNGDASNDPTITDIDGSWPHEQPANWEVKSWTSDWYAQSDWEAEVSNDFYYSVQLRRYGGDLQGVIDRLDHIQSLGVNAIYLNPINDAPSLHKYDARNYRHVDRNFGPDPAGDAAIMEVEDPVDPATWQWTSADSLFLKLIEEIHRREMRVIVDYSWNHTGMTFWAFRNLVERQRDSPYKDWYRVRSFDDPETPANEFDYVGWAGVRELPDLAKSVPGDDYERRPLEGDLHPGPKKLAFDVTRRWLDPNGDGDPADGVDGFRLDVAEMIPLGFWRDYRRHVKSINPEAFLVGEIWWEKWPERMLDPAPWIGDVFDAVMNYRWYMPTRSVVTGAEPRVAASGYRAHLDSVEAGIPRANLEAMMNVAASHDSPRLVTSLQNKGVYKNRVIYRESPQLRFDRPDRETRDLQKVFLVQQYTYYGAPHIWAGDELGMWGGDDPDNRKPLWWPELDFDAESVAGSDQNAIRQGRAPSTRAGFDAEILNFYQRLGGLREDYSEVLVSGEYVPLFAFDDRRVLGYERRTGDERLAVVLNAGNGSFDANISGFGFLDARIVFSTGAASLDDGLLAVGPRSAVVVAESSIVP